MTKKQFYGANRAIKIGLGVAVAVLLSFWPTNCAFAQSELFDNFESYELGVLTGQGGWSLVSGNPWSVVDTESKTGFKSMSLDKSLSGATEKTSASKYLEGGLEFWLKSAKGSSGYYSDLSVSLRENTLSFGRIGITYAGKLEWYHGGEDKGSYTQTIGDIPDGGWFKVVIEWNKTQFRVNALGVQTEFMFYTGGTTINEGINKIRFHKLSGHTEYSTWFADDIDGVFKEKRVWVSNPESGTTITNIEDSLTINWEGWDFESIYKDFFFYFYEENTGVVPKTIYYTPTTESGSVVYSFSDFDLDINSKWHFSARARSYLIGWTEYRTTNLVDPPFHIFTNIDGWEAPFAMPNWETWYSEKVDRFDTPTAVFSGVVSFLDPLYNRIGEFGNRTRNFLDPDEASEIGFNLGKAIPLFRHYVSEIEQFFGGFPVITIFLIVLILLLAIFIIRLILKFIPGLG